MDWLAEYWRVIETSGRAGTIELGMALVLVAVGMAAWGWRTR